MVRNVIHGQAGKFFSRTTRVGGTQSIAHGLGVTPTIVVAYQEGGGDGKVAQGSHDATNLALNPSSSGLNTVIYAEG